MTRDQSSKGDLHEGEDDERQRRDRSPRRVEAPVCTPSRTYIAISAAKNSEASVRCSASRSGSTALMPG